MSEVPLYNGTKQVWYKTRVRSAPHPPRLSRSSTLNSQLESKTKPLNPESLTPKPHTPHPTPQIPNPKPQTSNLNPKPQTPNSNYKLQIYKL